MTHLACKAASAEYIRVQLRPADFDGTELIYRSGHGLLHIPELPASWFATQRWLCLDASWASLFPPGCGSP